MKNWFEKSPDAREYFEEWHDDCDQEQTDQIDVDWFNDPYYYYEH